MGIFIDGEDMVGVAPPAPEVDTLDVVLLALGFELVVVVEEEGLF